MRIDNQPIGDQPRRKPMFTSRTSTSLMALGVALAMPVSNAFSGNFTLSNTVGTYNGAVVIPGSYQGQAFQGVMTSGQFSTSASGYADPNGNTDHIYIGSSTAILNWAPNDTGTTGNINFLPAGKTVSFEGDGVSNFTVINRILPTTESRAIELNGAINSFTSTSQSNIGGNVWIYSPGGILVGNTAQINVGGLVLSTLDPTNFSGNHATFANTSGLTTTGAVTVLQQAQISAQNTGAYVAIVAPAISQQGTVTTDGAAAYVAAEQADITINGNLFDINITTGSDANNGFALQHSGTTVFGSGVSAGHSIYLVTMPKNSAVTLLLTGNTSLGFDVASSAELQGDSIVLSAGHNVVNGGIDYTSGTGSASLQISGGRFNANTFAAARGFASVNSFQGQTLRFASSLHVHGGTGVQVAADGAGSVLSIAGDAILSTAKSFGLTDGPLTGANVSLLATSSGSVQIGGDAILVSQVIGQGVSGFGVSATGGNVTVNASNVSAQANAPAAQLTIGGVLDISSQALAAAGVGGGVKTLQGGQVFLGASANSVVSLGSLRIDAGAGPASSGVTDVNATGGRVDVYANGGSLSVAGASNIYSWGVGADSNVGTVGGSGHGGLVYVSAAVNSSATFNGLNIETLGIGGAGTNGANGGIGTGGTASLGTGGTGNVGQSVTNNGLTRLIATGTGGDSDSGTGGLGTGGNAIVFNAGGTTTLGAIIADASGFGGSGARGGAAIGGGAPGINPNDPLLAPGGASVNAAAGTLTINGIVDLAANADSGSSLTDDVAGNANGGQTGIFRSGAGTTSISGAVTASSNAYADNPADDDYSIGGGVAKGGNFAINGNSGAIQLSSGLTVHADGFGGSGNENLANIAPGTGTGGRLNIFTSAGASVSIGGPAILSADGHGGAAPVSPAGAIGTGGYAFIGGNGSVSLTTLDLSASGFGGTGALGGNGVGGQAYLQPNPGGTVTVTGGAVMHAEGTGGDGYEGFGAVSVGPSGSTGGAGIGGTAELFVDAGTANISNYLVLLAHGQGGTGGNGGNGTGGFAGIFARAGGTVTVTDGGSSSYGVGAFVSAGGTGGAASYGGGGTGGNGAGGTADVEALTISTAPNAISTITLGTLRAEAFGLGGNGGYYEGAGPGGLGGDGRGGAVFAAGSAGGGRIDVTDATLDAGGFGGTGGDGGYDYDNGVGYVGGAGGLGYGGNVQGGVFSGTATTATSGSASFGTYRAYAVGGGGNGGNGGYDGESENYNAAGGAGGRGIGGGANILARGTTVTANTIQFALVGQGGAGGDGTTMGAGGAGFGGGATLASTTRFNTTVAGTLTSSNGVVGNIDGFGGSGSTTGAATNGGFTVQALGGSTMTLGGLNLTNSGSFGTVPRFDANNMLVDAVQVPSEISALGGSTITINGNLSLRTPGATGITADAGSLIAVSGTSTINAGSMAAYVAQNGSTPLTTIQSTGTFRAGSLALTVADSITTGTAFQQTAAVPLVINAPNNVTIGGATANGAVQIESTAGALTILGGVNGTGAALRGLTGLSVGNVQVTNSINLISNGNITTGALTATNGVIAAGSVLGQTSITPTAGTIIANGPIFSGRSTYLSAVGDITTGAIATNDGIKIFTGGTARLGALSTGAVPVQSPTDAYAVTIDAQGDLVVVGSTTARGNVGLLSRAGSIDAQGDVGSTTADVVLLAASNVTTGALSAGNPAGGVYIANSTMYAAEGGSLDPTFYLSRDPVAIGGTVTVNGTVTANLFKTAALGSANLGGAVSAGLVDITANGVTATSTINSGSTTRISSGAGIALNGSLISAGDVSMTAASGVTSTNSVVVRSVNGAVAIAGDVSAPMGGVALLSPVSISVRDIVSGGVAQLGAIINTATGMVTPTAGTITARNINTGLSADLNATGNVTTGTITAGDSVGVTTGGNAVLGALSAGATPSQLAQRGFVVGINAQGDVTTGSVYGRGNVGILANGGSIATGGITSLSDIVLLAHGNVATGALSAGDPTGGVYIANATMYAGEGGSLDPAAYLPLDPVAIGGTLTVNGGVTANQIKAAALGAITSGAINVQQRAELVGSGPITTGLITSAGSVSLNSSGALSIAGISAGAAGDELSVALVGSNVTIGSSQAPGSVQAGGGIGIVAQNGNIVVGNVTTSDSVALLASNNVTAGSVTTGTAGTVYVANASMFATLSGDSTTNDLFSQTPVRVGGAISLAGPISTGTLNLAGNSVTLGSAVNAGAIRIDSATALQLPNSLTATGALSLLSAADITTGTVQAGGAVQLISSAGSVTTGAITAGRGITLTATGGITTGDLIAVTRISASGNGGAVRVGNVESSGGAVSLFANGTLGTGNIRAAGSIDLTALGAVTAGNLTAGTGPLVADSATGVVNGNGGTSANGTGGVSGGVVSGFDSNFVQTCDDCFAPETALGFAANYFGTTYSTTYVSNNGYVTFGQGSASYTPTGLGADYVGPPIIAAFFADVDTNNSASGRVSYGTGSYAGRNAFGATWNGVGYYSSKVDKTNKFQIVLTDRTDTGTGNFDIYLNYASIGWETGEANGGVAGLGGNSAAVGFNAGTGAAGSYFEVAGSRVAGSFINGGTSPLISMSNDGVAGQFLFTVRNGMVVAPTTGKATINITTTGAAAGVNADIVTGDLKAEAVNIAGGGKVTVGAVAVSDLNSGGTSTGVPFGVTIDATGDLFAGAVNAAGFVDLSSGAAINVGAVGSNGSITLEAGSTLATASLQSGLTTGAELGIGVEAVGNVSLGGVTSTADIGLLSRTGNITTGNIATGGNIALLAANAVSAGAATTGSSGALYVGSASMYSQLRDGTLFADLLALTPVRIGGAIQFTGPVSSGRFDVAGNAFSASSSISATTLRVNSAGAIALGGAVSGGSIGLSGASLNATAPITATTLTVATTGAATFGGKLTSTGALSFTGGAFTVAAIDAGSLGLTSTGAVNLGGAVNAGAFTASATSFGATAPISATSISVTSNGAANFGGAVTTSGAFGVNAASFTAGSSVGAGSVAVTSSGAANFGGAVTTTGAFGVNAASFTAGSSIGAGNVTIASSGNASFVGAVSAPTISVTSADIAIGQAASLGGASTTALTLTSSTGQTTIGGTAQTAGYLLDAAEIGRLRATQISVATAGDATVQAFALNAATQLNGANGGFGLTSPGVIRVAGNVDFTNMVATNSAAFTAGTRFEVATDSGRLRSLGSDNIVNGVISISATNIAVGKSSLLSQLATDPRFVGRDAALAAGETGDAVNNAGFVQAGRLNFATGNTLLVANSGTSTAPAGVTVGTGGVNITALGNGTTPIDVVLFGNAVSATGTPVSQAETFNAVVVDSAATPRITTGSGVNGCAFGSITCGAAPIQTVAQNQVVQIAASIQSAISGSGTSPVGPGSDGGGPAGGSGAGGGSDDGDDGGDDGGDDAAAAASSSVKVNVLIDTSSIGGGAPTIDTPVTSSGNSSLWGGEDGLSGDAGTPSDGPNGPTEMNP